MPNGQTRETVIETRRLSMVYGSEATRVEALHDVDLQVFRGEIVAIMGPSGSGKSTLLNLLGAIEAPTSGQVLLDQVDIAQLSDRERTLLRRRRLGFIFQAYNLLPILTVLENVTLPLELDGVRTAEARRRAAAILEQVGLGGRVHHVPGMLSGGEQQRVAIARALVVQPALVLADEPTGNLDSVNGGRIMELLRRLVDERHETIVMVTHDEGIAATADRIVRLRDGRIESLQTGKGNRVAAGAVAAPALDQNDVSQGRP